MIWLIVVDPNVFADVAGQHYTMFFGQSSSASSTGGEQINLYRANLDQSIFSN